MNMRFRTSTSGIVSTISVACHIRYVEHVEVTVKYEGYRGKIQLYLLSPTATHETRIFNYRPYDNYIGLVDHKFMTVHQWGENPNGDWKLRLNTTHSGEYSKFHKYIIIRKNNTSLWSNLSKYFSEKRK